MKHTAQDEGNHSQGEESDGNCGGLAATQETQCSFQRPFKKAGQEIAEVPALRNVIIQCGVCRRTHS